MRVLIVVLVILLVIVLTACSTTQGTVNIPVAVSCVSSVPVSPNLSYAPGTYAEVFPMVRDLKGDRELMLGYQGELEAVIKGCK